MKTAILILIITFLAGCTGSTNRMALKSHSETLSAYARIKQEQAASCAIASQGCREDMCRVATLLACQSGNDSTQMPSAPRLRYPGQDWAVAGRVFTSVASLGLAAYQVREANRTTRFIEDSNNRALSSIVASGDQAAVSIAGEFGGALGSSFDAIGNQPPATQIGGDQITIGGDQIGRDQIGRDQIDADQIGDRGDAADNGSVINNGRFRDDSPGPFDDSGNDNSTGGDNP